MSEPAPPDALDLDTHVLQLVRAVIDREQADPGMQLYEVLRLLGKYRSQLIANKLLQDKGRQVRTGPFAGMLLSEDITEGCHAPKLLGTYEQALHPLLASLSSQSYDTVLNIGCAEGYYAVGLAMLLNSAKVHAFDTNPKVVASCRAIAEANGVAEQVRVGTTFKIEDFEAYAGAQVLLVCDIEGAEVDLLDPTAAPALSSFDILVEVHDLFVPGAADILRRRFADSHTITEIPFTNENQYVFGELDDLENIDQLLALWEWRLPKNYWLWLEARS